MAQSLKQIQPGFEELYFTSKGFLGPQKDSVQERIFHGFFGRSGGHSTDVYDSLNCGPGSDDNPQYIAQNREIVCKSIGCQPDDLLTLYQEHGKKCLSVKQGWVKGESRPKADALVTDVPGLALGILTADCAPVLFYAEKLDGTPVVGAAHAGWGGALKGILEETLQKMMQLGAEKQTIKACIGPCIGKLSYEVREEFSLPFLKEDDENEHFFSPAQKSEHLMFDLAGYCAAKLYKNGVSKVSIKDLDTYFNEEDFFSYRRATHRGEKDYGRQISTIMIRP